MWSVGKQKLVSIFAGKSNHALLINCGWRVLARRRRFNTSQENQQQPQLGVVWIAEHEHYKWDVTQDRMKAVFRGSSATHAVSPEGGAMKRSFTLQRPHLQPSPRGLTQTSFLCFGSFSSSLNNTRADELVEAVVQLCCFTTSIPSSVCISGIGMSVLLSTEVADVPEWKICQYKNCQREICLHRGPELHLMGYY